MTQQQNSPERDVYVGHPLGVVLHGRPINGIGRDHAGRECQVAHFERYDPDNPAHAKYFEAAHYLELKALLKQWPVDRLVGEGQERVERFLAQFPDVHALHQFYEATEPLRASTSVQCGFAYRVATLLFETYDCKQSEKPVQERIEPHLMNWPCADEHDARAVLVELENRLIVAGGHEHTPENLECFLVRRLCDTAFQLGREPVRAPEGHPIEAPRVLPVTLDGYQWARVPAFAVFDLPHGLDKGGLDGRVLIYRGRYPDATGTPPLLTLPLKTLLRGCKSTPELKELARIFRYDGDEGGYLWGNNLTADGDYAGRKLAQLCLSDYARMTGGSVANGLGGAWPQVRITTAGKLAIVRSGTLHTERVRHSQEVAFLDLPEYPDARIAFDVTSGAVLGPIPPGMPDSQVPVRIDVQEWHSAFPELEQELAGARWPLPIFSYQTARGSLEPADEFLRRAARSELGSVASGPRR